MSDMPPRRSRRSASTDSGSPLPLIPILIGVIVLGFVIGAGLSIAGKHGGSERTVIANVAPTRVPTLPPVTPAPTEKPTVAPTDLPATLAPATDATAAPATRAPATKVPATKAPATKGAATTAPVSQVAASPPGEGSATAGPPAPSASPPAPRAPASTPKVAAKAPPAAAASVPANSPEPTDDVDSDFGKLASAVVRQYIAAIARGDTATATAAFGPDATNVQLVESGIVGAGTRIQHVEARGAGDNETVNVDLKTPNGLYFGQYTVHRTTSGAALITDHAINKL